MERNRLVDLFGDYMAQVQPGPNAQYQNELIQRNFNPSPVQQSMLNEARRNADMYTSASDALLTAGVGGIGVGGGLTAGGAPIGPPLLAGGALAAGAGGLAGAMSNTYEDKYYRQLAEMYPGIYGSQ